MSRAGGLQFVYQCIDKLEVFILLYLRRIQMLIKQLSVFGFFKKPERQLAGVPDWARGYDKTRTKQNIGSVCHAPSANMYFSQTGEVRVCCHNMEFVAGRYPEQTIQQIWKGVALKAIREDMKNYQLNQGCEVCLADLKRGSFQEVRASHFDNIPKHPEYPTQMEFLLTNTCNLECVMCKGEFSSSIRQNREHLPPIPNVYDEAFLQQLEEFIPYLHEARFSGSGEAFLIEANFRIWEKIIRLNPKCIIMIQTNGTVLNSRIKELLESGRFQIGVSLDSLKKEVFEAIRPNSKFERVMENIHYFSAYSQKHKRKFAISTCVMRQNWRELPEFVRFSNELKAVQNFHKVWHPHEYSLYNMSATELMEVDAFLLGHNFDATSHTERINKNHYKYFQETVHHWYEAAVDYERVQNQLDDYNAEKLLQLVEERSRRYLLENSQDLEGNIERQHNEFMQKIHSLLDVLPFESLRKKALREMCRAEIKYVAEAVLHNNVAELLLIARKQLGF